MTPPQSSFYTPGRRLPHNNSYIYIDHCYVQHYAPHLPASSSLPSASPTTPQLNASLTSPPPTSLPPRSAAPSEPAKPPILFIHGGGLTGAVWDATPDGRPSWARRAAERGHAVFVLDAVDSGRSMQAPDRERAGAMEHRTAREVWSRFRFGPDTDEAFGERRGWGDGVGQFGRIGGGGDDEEEGDGDGKGLGGEEQEEEGRRRRMVREAWFENLLRGQSARRRNTDLVEARGIRDAVGMIGTCWIVAHSHGAAVALQAMRMDEEAVGKTETDVKGLSLSEGTEMERRIPGEGVRMRDLVEKMVLVEPGPSPGQPPWGKEPQDVNRLIVWGDYLKGHRMWESVMKGYTEQGTAESMLLPEKGIRGNSHFPMCDKNSDAVWSEIYAWLAGEQGVKAM